MTAEYNLTVDIDGTQTEIISQLEEILRKINEGYRSGYGWDTTDLGQEIVEKGIKE